jgi:hypothetical protein
MSVSLSLPIELLEYVIELAVAVPNVRNALPLEGSVRGRCVGTMFDGKKELVKEQRE